MQETDRCQQVQLTPIDHFVRFFKDFSKDEPKEGFDTHAVLIMGIFHT